jgi:chromosomal replication initiation ATPase DnaA
MGCGTATPTSFRSQHNQLSQMNMMNQIHLDPTAVIHIPVPRGWKRTWMDIVRQVCREHGVTQDDLTGRCRTERVLEARADLYWYARRDTALSLQAIGERTGGRDHTSVMSVISRAIARKGAPK